MMGSRGWKGGLECDAFSRKWKRAIGGHGPGVVKFAKRKFWKRQRRKARREIRSNPD